MHVGHPVATRWKFPPAVSPNWCHSAGSKLSSAPMIHGPVCAPADKALHDLQCFIPRGPHFAAY
eukprot:2362308-Amphidinium_carterae.1